MSGPAGEDRHAEIHRQLAAALAELVPDDPSIPPHPYLRRHLAQHAAQGRVLDDTHVPPALLPWESSSGLGRLLAGEGDRPVQQQWLQTWATLEPYARDLSPLSRLTSLHLAHHAALSRDTPSPRPGAPDAPFDRSPVTPLWSDCASPDNVWALNDADVVSLTSTVPRPRAPHQALLVTGDDHGVVRVLRRDGSASAPPIPLHEGAVAHLLTLPEGIVATGSTDGAVAMLDANRGRPIRPVVRRTGAWVTALTLHRPRHDRPPVLLAAWSDGHLAAYDTTTLKEARVPLPSISPAPALLRGTTGPDGSALLLVAQHDTVTGFDGRTTRILSRHPAAVRTLVAPAEPGLYAVGDADGTLSVHGVDAASRTRSTRATTSGAVTALAVVTVEGRETLASGGADGTVRLWRPESLEPVGASLQAHSEAVTALAALPERSGTRLITAGSDHTIRNWPLAGAEFRHGRTGWHRVTASALSSGPAHLLAVTEGTTTLVRSIGTGEKRSVIDDEPVTALAWAGPHHRPVLAAALSDNSIALHTPGPGGGPTPPPRLRGHFSPALALLALPGDGSGSGLLASGSADGTVRLWDLDRHRAVAVFDDHRFSVRCLAATRTDDGVVLASGGSDGNLRVWDVTALAQRGPTIRCGQNIVNDVAFARPRGGAGLRLVTAGQNGTLRLWDPDAPSGHLAELDPGDGELHAVTAFRTHGSRVVLAAAGATGIHLWDAAAERLLLQIVTGRPVSTLRTAPRPEGEPSTVLLATGEAGTLIFRVHHDRLRPDRPWPDGPPPT